MTIIKHLVLDGHKSRAPKEWPAHDGTMLDRAQYVSASETGGCEREIWYKKNSPRDGDRMNGFAERGHTAEAWLVERLQTNTQGYTFHYVGEDQRSFYTEYQSGTPDGIMVDPMGLAALLEFKCIDPRSNWNALPKQLHVTQCQQNMDLVNRLTDYNIKEAIIVYIDASNYSNIKEFLVEYDAEAALNLRLRARKIMTLKKAVDATPEGVYNGNCKWCDYKDMCSGAVEQKKRETEKLKGMTNVSTKFFS